MNTRQYLLTLIALLLLTPGVYAQPDADEPSLLHRPFTAEQIRDEWVAGFTIDMERRTPEGTVVERWTVVAADAEGVEIEFAKLESDGNTTEERKIQKSSWVELRNHASFPADHSTLEEVTRETALGTLDGWLYTVRDEETGTVTEFFFARSLPGAPVRMRTTRDGEFVMELTQIARSRRHMTLIPGGEFVMGKDDENNPNADHSPAHLVRIDAFYLDKYEVTNAQYLEYCEQTGARLPEFWGMKEFRSGPDFPDHPVVGISAREAQEYAEWAGKRLPTEAEWEFAARGGLAGMDYPHGELLEETDANYWSWPELWSTAGGLMPVGSYPANGYGLHDMAGNVVEWVADAYDADYYAHSPADNPSGPEPNGFRVIRGGGWHSGPGCVRVFYRNALPVNWRDFNVGFRCARDAGRE